MDAGVAAASPEESPDRELASLTRVAQVLRELPRERVSSSIKIRFAKGEYPMSEGTAAVPVGTGETKASAVHYQRPGLTAITPYHHRSGPAAQFIEFLKSAFEGVERMRMPAPDGFHHAREVANR